MSALAELKLPWNELMAHGRWKTATMPGVYAEDVLRKQNGARANCILSVAL
jgi:hypothetical protein